MRRSSAAQSPLVRWLQRGYDAILARTVNAPRLALVTAGVITLIGLAALPFLSQSLLPSFKEPNLLIHLDGAPGTSQPEMNRIAARPAGSCGPFQGSATSAPTSGAP